MQLTGGGIGGLHQNKNPLVLFAAHFQQRLDAIGAQIAVDRECIGSKRLGHHVFHLGGAQMGSGVCGHGGTDVIALAVGDDEHPVLLGIGDGFGEGFHTLPAVHLIVGSLGLHSRYDVAQGVDQPFVELEQRIGGAFQGLAVLFVALFPDIIGNVTELGI